MGAAKTGFLIPKDVWRSPGTEIKQEAAKQDVQHNMSLLKAWTPYLLVTLWLVATRVPQLGIKPFMSSLPISVSNIMGVEGANFPLKWLNTPGLFPFILVVFIGFALYGLSGEQIKNVLYKSYKQLVGATIALLFGFAMVYLFRYSNANVTGYDSMLVAMAKGMTDLAGCQLLLCCTCYWFCWRFHVRLQHCIQYHVYTTAVCHRRYYEHPAHRYCGSSESGRCHWQHGLHQ